MYAVLIKLTAESLMAMNAIWKAFFGLLAILGYVLLVLGLLSVVLKVVHKDLDKEEWKDSSTIRR